MTEENQKDFLSPQINIYKMHLAVHKHDVLVIIIKTIPINVFILSDEYIDQLTYNKYTPI